MRDSCCKLGDKPTKDSDGRSRLPIDKLGAVGPGQCLRGPYGSSLPAWAGHSRDVSGEIVSPIFFVSRGAGFSTFSPCRQIYFLNENLRLSSPALFWGTFRALQSTQTKASLLGTKKTAPSLPPCTILPQCFQRQSLREVTSALVQFTTVKHRFLHFRENAL